MIEMKLCPHGCQREYLMAERKFVGCDYCGLGYIPADDDLGWYIKKWNYRGLYEDNPNRSEND